MLIPSQFAISPLILYPQRYICYNWWNLYWHVIITQSPHYFKVLSWCCTFYVCMQMYSDIGPSLEHLVEYFNVLSYSVTLTPEYRKEAFLCLSSYICLGCQLAAESHCVKAWASIAYWHFKGRFPSLKYTVMPYVPIIFKCLLDLKHERNWNSKKPKESPSSHKYQVVQSNANFMLADTVYQESSQAPDIGDR